MNQKVYKTNLLRFDKIIEKLKSEFINILISPSSNNRFNVISDVPGKGIELELRADYHCEFAFKFYNEELYNYEILSKYFRKRLKYDDVNFFINSKRIYVKISKGESDTTLDKVFYYVLKEIQLVVDLQNED